MHLLDDSVTQVLHQIFDRMAAASDNIIVGSAQDRHIAELRADIKRVKAENSKANTEYELLKAEVIKAVQGKSKMPTDILSELVNESRDRVLATSERLTSLTAELERGNTKAEEMKNELSRIRTWSEIFDDSDIEVKKMITNYIIKRVNVYEGYKLNIELNLNELWEADIKYGYITGENKFFFVLSIIDVFDRSIIDYYMGYNCTGADAASLLRRSLLKRNLFNSEKKPVIRTDNGPQFISHAFEDCCNKINIYHERIPSRTPNKNAHIESFHRIFQDECIGIYEFEDFSDAYVEVSSFMKRYNNLRLHSSLKYMAPNEFYSINVGKEIESMAIHL